MSKWKQNKAEGHTKNRRGQLLSDRWNGCRRRTAVRSCRLVPLFILSTRLRSGSEIRQCQTLAQDILTCACVCLHVSIDTNLLIPECILVHQLPLERLSCEAKIWDNLHFQKTISASSAPTAECTGEGNTKNGSSSSSSYTITKAPCLTHFGTAVLLLQPFHRSLDYNPVAASDILIVPACGIATKVA